MNWKRTYMTATASEAERITGWLTGQQRDQRRFGFLPPLEGGKAAFEPPILAGMIIAKALNDHGIPPSIAWPLARSCSAVVISRLFARGAGVADPGGLLKEPLIHNANAGGRYLVTADGRSWVWVKTAGEVGDHLSLASIVLDLDLAGQQLLERAGRPLVVIEPEIAPGSGRPDA